MSTNYISQITATDGVTYDVQEGVTTRIFRATCTTSAGTAAKVATLDDNTGYSLTAGVRVAVTFTYGNTATSPTLNVNSGGAKYIYYSTAITTYQKVDELCVWGANETVIFTYNGSSWVMMGSSLALYNAYNKAASSGSGTVTSVGVSNATNGGLSISGSPITSNGTITIGHSNILSSAQTTQAVYPIKIDKNGHISAYGSAVTIPTKTSDLTNDSGFITSYTDTKNTAGSTNSTSKLYLIGATEQSANPQTYSNSYLYYSSGLKSTVSSGNGAVSCDINQTATSITLKYDGTSSGNKLTIKNNKIEISGNVYLSNYGDSYSTNILSSATSSNKTITFPNATGTVALTSDIPTVPTKTSDLTNDSGFITNSSLNNYLEKSYTGSNQTGSIGWATNDSNIIHWFTQIDNTTEDTHSYIGMNSDTVGLSHNYNDGEDSFTSEILVENNHVSMGFGNDSGLGDSYYLEISGYNGYEFNSINNNNHYNIYMPQNKSGTVALTSDIPTETTVSGWGFTKNTGTLTGVTFAGTSMSVSSGVASITQANARTALGLATVATSGSYNDLSNKPTIPTNTDEKVKLTSNTGSTAVPLVLGPTSITSGTAYNCLYNTNLKYTPSTGNLQTTQINGVTVGSSPKFTDSEVSTLTLASGSTTGTSLSFGSKYTLTAGSKTVSFTMPSSPTDTKNTAGSTNSSSALYLIGATSQAANPQTYSNGNLYFNDGLHSTTSQYTSTISQENEEISLAVETEDFGIIDICANEVGSHGYSGIYIDSSVGVTIKHLNSPTENADAANKKYVDDNTGSKVKITRW